LKTKRYWSIQTKEAWEQAIEKGYLEGTYEYIEDFEKPYKWMMNQMSSRLESYKGEIPIWLWVDKPDMRLRGHSKSGDEMVRLTVKITPDRVLLSDFESWHMVLNNTFCALNEKEYDNAKNSFLTKEQSWERIFNMNIPRDVDWIGDLRLQGTTGRLQMTDVVKVENFVAR